MKYPDPLLKEDIKLLHINSREMCVCVCVCVCVYSYIQVIFELHIFSKYNPRY